MLCDTKELFSKMKVGSVMGYEDNMNEFNVIKLDMNGWYNNTPSRSLLFDDLNESLREEFEVQFPSVGFKPTDNLARCILRVYGQIGEKFVIIIDEYDVLVREKVSDDLFRKYLF